jgi:hypothetical protein
VAEAARLFEGYGSTSNARAAIGELVLFLAADGTPQSFVTEQVFAADHRYRDTP